LQKSIVLLGKINYFLQKFFASVGRLGVKVKAKSIRFFAKLQ
jgi:hypothetical protein